MLFSDLKFDFIFNRIIYDLDCGRKLKEIPAHLDAVSCLAYIESIGVLISGSWDGYVKLVLHLVSAHQTFQ